MSDVNTPIGSEGEYISQEYRESWLNVLIDEILLECYEGLL